MQSKILNSDFQNYHTTHKNAEQNKTLPSCCLANKTIYTWELKKIYKHLQNPRQYYSQTWLLLANYACNLKSKNG